MARVVDVHSHFLPLEVVELLREGGYPLARAVQRPEGTWIVCERGLQFELTPLFHDAGAKLEWMDAHGIDVSLTSIAAPLFLYELDVERLDELCRQVNDAAARLAAASDGRIVGMATVPITQPELAAAEVRRACGELGLKGVEIGTSVGGQVMLDDASLDPFYAAAAEAGAPVLLHPYTYMLGLQSIPGFGRFFLLNNVGNMVETHLAAARMMLGGVFDRHPSLRVQLSHGGGGLPFQLARLDHTYHKREAVREVAKRSPFQYLDNFLFDTVVYDPRPLRFLLELVGPERVVFGTDHPFDIADVAGLESVRALDGEAAEKVLHQNAARAYGI
ncbi:MAG TPA: amidohydrolase family protein [Conexibacter sp.]|jgi:aminocarboxymuconate-semialdehyde decarboxylase